MCVCVCVSAREKPKERLKRYTCISPCHTPSRADVTFFFGDVCGRLRTCPQKVGVFSSSPINKAHFFIIKSKEINHYCSVDHGSAF